MFRPIRPRQWCFMLRMLGKHFCSQHFEICFKSAIDRGISKFVPIKRFGTKKSLSWIIQEIKRLARKRNKLFQLQRKTGKSKDRHHFKQVKYLVRSKFRSAYDNYLQDLLGLAAQSAEENPSGFISKKLYSL